MALLVDAVSLLVSAGSTRARAGRRRGQEGGCPARTGATSLSTAGCRTGHAAGALIPSPGDEDRSPPPAPPARGPRRSSAGRRAGRAGLPLRGRERPLLGG